MLAAATVRPSLRDRQRSETHDEIRRCAVKLAKEHGASAVSVHAVCAAAGVSPRTFFNHFRSKDEALVPDLPDFAAEDRQAFVDRVDPDLVAALERLITGFARVVQQDADRGQGPVAMKQLLAANPELLPRVLAVFEVHERRLAELVAARTGRRTEDLFCTVTALAATAATRAAFGAWHDAEAQSTSPHPARASSAVEPRLEALIPAAFDVLRELGAR